MISQIKQKENNQANDSKEPVQIWLAPMQGFTYTNKKSI